MKTRFIVLLVMVLATANVFGDGYPKSESNGIRGRITTPASAVCDAWQTTTVDEETLIAANVANYPVGNAGIRGRKEVKAKKEAATTAPTTKPVPQVKVDGVYLSLHGFKCPPIYNFDTDCELRESIEQLFYGGIANNLGENKISTYIYPKEKILTVDIVARKIEKNAASLYFVGYIVIAGEQINIVAEIDIVNEWPDELINFCQKNSELIAQEIKKYLER